LPPICLDRQGWYAQTAAAAPLRKLLLGLLYLRGKLLSPMLNDAPAQDISQGLLVIQR